MFVQYIFFLKFKHTLTAKMYMKQKVFLAVLITLGG